MKILIDTNVLVSAVLRDRDPETVILFVVEQPDIEWVVSPEIVTEYKEVLARDKFNLPSALLQRWYQMLDNLTTNYIVKSSITYPRDQKDAKFLDCALASKADFFVTGDKDFSEAQKLVRTIILSVSLFKKLVIDTAHL
jgi:putative PIN family toxin of toxin-antitoxin system